MKAFLDRQIARLKDHPESVPSSIVSREAALELVLLHARMLRRMPLIQLMLVVGFWLLIASSVSPQRFLVWTALTLTVECIRAFFGARTLQRASIHDADRYHRLFAILAGLSGSVIGLGAVLFLPGISVEQRAAVGFLLTGIPAAGVAVSQSSKYIIGAYALGILIPSSLAWGSIYPDQATGVFGLALVYSIVLMAVAADNSKLMLRSISIRHERDRIVKELEQSNAEVRNAMAKAEQSAQARARVLAAASHDLRQPLHALSVYSAILAASPTPETLREVGHDVDQIVRSLGSLMGGLLDLSRLSTDYYVPEKVVCSLERIVNGVCNELQPAAAAKGLTLIRVLEPSSLCSDSVAIGRIARNLLENAVKYTEQGEIRVTTGIDGDRAILVVADTGKGIPVAEQGRIFEEFYQLDNPGRDRSRGVGLGLAIVQRLCELLDARIGVESTLGSGARFTVAFRGLNLEHTDAGEADSVARSASLQGVRVYVVDDESDITAAMSKLLSLWGMSVRVADSVTALEALFQAERQPDLLIADLRLSGQEHGAAAASRLRLEYGNFPVIIMTGDTASNALRDANEAGYASLQKPIPPDLLRSAINAALAH